MGLEEKWNRVIKETDIIRHRLKSLHSHDLTELPYTFLGASLINQGDTVVRQGKILVDRPMILLPKNLPQFSGFDFQEELGVDEDFFRSFLLIRGVRFPSMKYNHEISTIDVFEGNLDRAISHYGNELERKEDIDTGLIAGPTDAWQFCVLLYVCTLLQNSASRDMEELFRELKRRLEEDEDIQ